jgi:hypothetical protein
MLGCDSSIVCRILAELEIPAHGVDVRYPLPSENDVRDAYVKSNSAVELADRLGLTVATTRRALKRYSLPSYSAGRPRADALE